MSHMLSEVSLALLKLFGGLVFGKNLASNFSKSTKKRCFAVRVGYRKGWKMHLMSSTLLWGNNRQGSNGSENCLRLHLEAYSTQKKALWPIGNVCSESLYYCSEPKASFILYILCLEHI